MNITMIGTGYVGLVTGLCFAEFGFDVTCVDRNPGIIARLKKCESTIFEPGLDDFLIRNSRAGRVQFTTDMASAVKSAQIILIAVGTPTGRLDGTADLSYIMAAADEIADTMNDNSIIIIKSTVEVGTSAAVQQRISERRPGVPFHMVSNPEFLREGSAFEDFMRPDRVVIGTDSEIAREAMQRLYRPLNLRQTPIVFTTPENAELIKYAANGFLAIKVSFINQIADLCEKTGGNVQDVAKALGMDGRIGPKFLHPGPGFGGSCFPKDTRALAAIGRKHGAPQKLVEATEALNEARKIAMAERIIALAKTENGKTVALLGIAFKPNTDDIREAPALTIIEHLLAEGYTIRAHDPAAMEAAKMIYPSVVWCSSSYEAADGADVTVLVTEWNAYRAIDLARLAKTMSGKSFLDLRNVYQAADVKNSGLVYHSVGRAIVRG